LGEVSPVRQGEGKEQSTRPFRKKAHKINAQQLRLDYGEPEPLDDLLAAGFGEAATTINAILGHYQATPRPEMSGWADGGVERHAARASGSRRARVIR